MRRRFQFRLERVLAVRAIEEEVARAGWAEAETRALAAERALERARSELERGREELAGWQSAGRLDPARILAAQTAIGSLLAALRGARERALPLRAAAERARREWTERRQAEQALERLRERSRGRHAEALGRADAAALDEVAGQRAARAARAEARREGVQVPAGAAPMETGPDDRAGAAHGLRSPASPGTPPAGTAA